MPPGLHAASDMLTRMLVTVRLLAPDAQPPPAATGAVIARALALPDWPAVLFAFARARETVGLAWAESEDAAVKAAFETSRWSLTGWKVMSELPNPVNFEAAAQVVKPEDVAEAMPCGPDAAKHLAAIREYEDVGYDHVVLANNGPDPDGFMDFFARELKPALAPEP